MAEHIRLRRPRNETNPETDPPNFPSINQSTRSKSTIASLFNPTTTPKKKLNNFTQNTFRGFGCTAAASQQVSLPAVIRTSADWDGKKVKKKKKQKNNGSSSNNGNGTGEGSSGNGTGTGSGNPGNCMVAQDVWCGPGIGLSADAVVGSVDCVVSRRNVSGRGKIDGEKVNQRDRERERSSCLARRTVNPESLSFLDSDFTFAPPRPVLDVFGPRYYRHLRHPSPDGLAEIMMLQNSLLMGGRFDSHDHFRDWRLDVDNMTYEELLDLGDRIGYVSTGLKEDEIGRCLRKTKNQIKNDLSSHLSIRVDKKCTICQEEFEADDEMGKLDCGHSFHIQCIKQWLAHKNACPVCKAAVITQC
ncbi:hypothetical protein Ddye_015442 [Dipteronia dyeriana]|uniref:RING-type E3 ubiquitin transferase n=1 Tax=Dipteronia dyeriana TaxID=168575 RepID=A0AAD9U5K3_9ROSI|nr:hypothetical protein Ddye_015442 [Dipteronia dyeriana]